MNLTAAFDREIFYSPASRYTILQMKTADRMVPETARRPYTYQDHLIRFIAVGYDLPQSGAVKLELEGSWVDGKHGVQFAVERWNEILPSTVQGILAYLASGR